MKNIQKAQGQMYDFFHLKQFTQSQIVRAHFQAYINLAVIAFIVMGVFYLSNFRFSVVPAVQVVSPIVEAK